MATRLLPSRVSRRGKKAPIRNRPLRVESLELRMMLNAAMPATPTVLAPTIAQAITANGNLAVTGKTAAISVLGADATGAANLRYTWSITTAPTGGLAAFAANGNNAAQSTTMTFNEAGKYGLQVTIADTANLSVTATTTVTVSQTFSGVRLSDGKTLAVISPATPITISGTSESLVVQGLDQFGNLLSTQPTFKWSTTTLPSGASSPTFTTTSGGCATAVFSQAGTYGLAVQGTSGGTSLSSTATVVVNPVPGYITLTAASSSLEVKAATAQLTVNQFLDQFHNPLLTQPTLTWSATTLPSGAGKPTFSINGKTVTVTFSKAGSYVLTATISDGNGHSASQSETVIVDQVATRLGQTPATTVAVNGASQQFADPAVLDQFGNAMATQPGYTWVASIYPAGATVPTFGAGVTTTTATFHKAGTYDLKASVNGASALGFLTTVTVNQVATNLVIPVATLAINGKSQQFSNPAVLDQFGIAMAVQPGFTWVATTVPSGAPTPTFTTSGTTTTVTFAKAGSYGLRAYVTSASTVAFNSAVTVSQVATSLGQVPATTVAVAGTGQQFSDPVVLDQFGNALASQPAYTWSVTTIPSGAKTPTFTTSGTTTTVAFSSAGSYGLKAYVTGAATLAFSTTANVSATLTSITVSPTSATIGTGASQQFTAQALDQFHNVLATQPSFTWSASAGTITTAGLYTAPSTSGKVTVSVKSGTLGGSASLSVGGSNSLGLVDQTLANLVQSLDADGSISRLDMIQILRSVVSNGTLSATDLTDLQTIVGADAAKLNMPSYVQVLASDVVNSNPANAHYQGQALSKLAAGSTAATLNDLVNKWFFGTDLPNPGNSLFVYEPAAGSLYDPGSNTPVIADEFQGALGDCYFISSLGTIAQSNPAAIENMIVNNGDGTYTVRFYTGTYGATTNSNGSVSDGFTNGVGTADYVTVNTMLPTYNGRLVFADYETSYTATQNDLWIPLLEKAYAQWNETGKEGRDGTNTYGGIEGGWMATVDAQVLGHNATDYTLTTGNQQYVIAALAANKAVTTGTITSSNSSDTLPYGLYGCHAYAITGYNAASQTFTLYNPWGFDQPPAGLTWAEVMATTDMITVADTSGTVPIGGTPTKPGAVRASVAAAGLAANTPAAPLAALGGQSLWEFTLPPRASAAADSAALLSVSTNGSSSLAGASATRALFDRLGTDSGTASFTQHPGDRPTSERLAAFPVDELFAIGGGVAFSDFA